MEQVLKLSSLIKNETKMLMKRFRNSVEIPES